MRNEESKFEKNVTVIFFICVLSFGLLRASSNFLKSLLRAEYFYCQGNTYNGFEIRALFFVSSAFQLNSIRDHSFL